LSTYVFVPGGWHGGWCWKRVASRLRAAGHEVYTPTLTGLGERAHLLSPSVNLDTHITDVVGVVRWEDLDDVILVGHSFGGMIITGVADRIPERIATVVYLDALWPVDGERTSDVIGELTAGSVMAMTADPERPPLILEAEATARMLGATDPEDIAWLASKLTPQPAGAMTQPLGLKHAIGHRPVIYILCADWQPGPAMELSYSRAMQAAADNPAVKLMTLRAPHNAMVTHPAELTELLLGIG